MTGVDLAILLTERKYTDGNQSLISTLVDTFESVSCAKMHLCQFQTPK